MTHLLDTHAWIQRALGEPLPALVDQTLTRHAETLAIADISLREAAKLVELGDSNRPSRWRSFSVWPSHRSDGVANHLSRRCKGRGFGGCRLSQSPSGSIDRRDGVGAWHAVDFRRRGNPPVGRVPLLWRTANH